MCFITLTRAWSLKKSLRPMLLSFAEIKNSVKSCFLLPESLEVSLDTSSGKIEQ